MVSKKISRSPKSISPTQPPEETKKAPSQAASAPKTAGPAPKKSAAAKPERRVATRRKRPADEAPSAENVVLPATVVSDEEIRVHAYFLSLRYLGSDRNDVDFWLLAERELRTAKTPGKP